MNRRPASASKSPLNTRLFPRRTPARGAVAPRFRIPALALFASLSLLAGRSAFAANTEYDVINGQTDLTNSGGTTYKTGGTAGTGAGGTTTATVPSVTSDVTFDSGVTYSPTAFTLGTSETFGSLNDLSTTAITISNTGGTAASILTLGGSGDLGDGVPGSNAADLLFVGTGANLTITGGTGVTALGLVLGQSGNFDIAGTAAISAAITGTGNLTRTGAGLLTLSGGINNTGTFTNSGTATTVYPGTSITAAPAGSTYINGAVGANVTGIIQNGTSDLVLNNIGTYGNGITIQNGIVIVSGGGTSLGATANTITLGNASTTSNATLDYASKVNGTSGVNSSFANLITVGPKTGEGANVISASDYGLTLTGAISLTGGDLTLAPSNSGGSTITVTGGITGTGNVFISDVSSNAGNLVTLSGSPINNTGTLTFNNATINGVAAGGGNTGTNVVSANIGSNVTQITQNSSTNQLTLSGTNTNSGPDTSAAGVLEFAQEVSLFDQTTPGTPTATASNLIVQPGATAAFEVGNTGGFTAADIAALNALGTSTGGFENGSRLGIDTTGGNFTYANAITNSNGGANVIGLTKLGANTLTLTATNTYSGPTVITAGTLQVGAGGTAGTLGTGSVINNATLTFDRSDNYGGAFSQSIGGTGALSVIGTGGTLTLSGVNTFTGATTVTAGTLDLANSLALENSTLTPPTTGGALTFDASVTSNVFMVGALTGANNLALQNNAGTPAGITLAVGSEGNNTSTTYSGILSGPGGLTRAGIIGDTLTLTGANTYTGATTLAGGTINLGNGTATGSISPSSVLVLAGGTLAYTNTATAATQTFNGTTIQPGASLITESLAGQTINLGAITHTTNGGTVDFGSTGTINTTTTANVNGILGGYATFGGRTTWAVAPATSGGAITGLTTFTTTATAGTAPAGYTAQNIDVTAAETLTGPINPNSLRFNSATALTLTLTGTNSITSGGILVTPTATAGGTITGGTLVGSAAGDLAVSSGDNNPLTGGAAALTVGSLIADNGTAATTVSMNGVNNRVELSLTNAANSFSGGLLVNEGVVITSTSGTPLGTGNITISPDGYTGSGGSLALNGSFTVATGLLVDVDGVGGTNGNIANSGGTFVLTLIGSGSATFNGIIGSYSGGRVINPVLDSGTQVFGNTEVGTSLVTVNGGTLQVGNGYLGTFADSANNVGLAVGGGTFSLYGPLTGTVTQSFNSGLAINAGGSTISVTNNSGAGALLALNTITRSAGGTVNFTQPSGTVSAINGITTTTLNTNGIIGGYATVGGTDWATNATNTSGGNVIGLSSSTINAYSTDTFGAGLNTDVTGSDTFPAGSTNSIRFNTAGANTLTLGGTGIVTSGGILVTSNVGANLTAITGNTLEGAAGADLVVIQNNTGGSLEIDSTIANNGTATGLTKSGAGTLILTGTNTYTGGTFLNGGILNTATAGIDGSSTTNGITFNGGTLQAATGGITTGKAVVIGATGGTIDTNGNAVTLSGVVSGTPSAGAGALGGFNSTGAFAFTKTGAGTLTLSGTGNAFGGPLVINNGTVLDSAASGAATFGTGYVNFVNNANTPTMDLGGHSATVAGLIGAGTNGLVTNSGTASSVLTLNGVSTQTFAGTIKDGATNTVGLTVALNNPTEAQVLTGANTYSGATTVNVGGLLVNGSLTPATAGTAAVTVGSTAAGGGTLGGTGTLTVSSVTVNTGGTLAPGATRGATTGALTLNTTAGLTITGGTLAIGIAGSGGTSLATNGTLTLGSGSILAVTGTANGTSDYDLANYGSLSGTFATANIPAGYTINYDGSTFSANDIELDVTAVPEPSTFVGGLMGLGLLGYHLRRRLGALGRKRQAAA